MNVIISGISGFMIGSAIMAIIGAGSMVFTAIVALIGGLIIMIVNISGVGG